MERKWEKDVLPLCQELGIGFVAFAPMGNGFLSGKYSFLVVFICCTAVLVHVGGQITALAAVPGDHDDRRILIIIGVAVLGDSAAGIESYNKAIANGYDDAQLYRFYTLGIDDRIAWTLLASGIYSRLFYKMLQNFIPQSADFRPAIKTMYC